MLVAPVTTVPMFHCSTVPLFHWHLLPPHTCLLLSVSTSFVIFHWNCELRELVICARGPGCPSDFCFEILLPLWSSLLFAGLFGIHCQCNAVRGKATDATLVSLAGALLLLKKQRVGGGEEGYGGTTPKFLIYIPLCPSLLPPPSRHVLTHPKPFWPLTIYLETQVNSQPQNTKVSHSVFITLKSQFWAF